jgi:signal transduction histidine kinase
MGRRSTVTTRDHSGRWGELLTMTRLLAAALAVLLLAVHHVTDYDGALIVVTVAWTAVSLGALRLPRVQRSAVAWLVDAAVALALIWASGDWRSAFYLYAITTLVLPATSLRFRGAVLWGLGYIAAYLAVAVATERLDGGTLRSTARIETIATHLTVPLVVVLALAYAQRVLDRLGAERERSERLAVEAERQRIAWELHDSAKQRVHAAHLVLSALDGALPHGQRAIVDQALGELRGATAEMDTSVAELREPLEGRPVEVLLRERAAELAGASTAEITVSGSLPHLSPLAAAHVYRIAAEALTNAVRHAQAEHIAVEMSAARPGAITIRDDGVGLASAARPDRNGLRSMRARAESIGAALRTTPAESGGTVVVLCLEEPLNQREDHQ